MRAGVAQDLQDKKRIVPDLFAFWLHDARVRFIGNTAGAVHRKHNGRDRRISSGVRAVVRRGYIRGRRGAGRDAGHPGRGIAGELVGTQRVERVRVTDTRAVVGRMADPARIDPRESSIPAGLVLRATGYRGHPVPGLPFNEQRGVIENHRGRVVSQGAVMRGVYVAGWIKRGARGIIGSNKACAAETVACLLDDHREGRLAAASMDAGDVMQILRARRGRIVSREGWLAIDTAEQRAGRSQDRPRVKITDHGLLLDMATN